MRALGLVGLLHVPCFCWHCSSGVGAKEDSSGGAPQSCRHCHHQVPIDQFRRCPFRRCHHRHRHRRRRRFQSWRSSDSSWKFETCSMWTSKAPKKKKEKMAWLSKIEPTQCSDPWPICLHPQTMKDTESQSAPLGRIGKRNLRTMTRRCRFHTFGFAIDEVSWHWLCLCCRYLHQIIDERLSGNCYHLESRYCYSGWVGCYCLCFGMLLVCCGRPCS